jgi:DNA-binding protein YbaB
MADGHPLLSVGNVVRVEGTRGTVDQQAQADEIAARVTAMAERVREQQATALAVTGSASSQDGTVRAVVDATGVVTALEFAPSALERSSLDKLARTTVATIQSAAAQARAGMAENWRSLQTVLATAAAGTERLGMPRVGVPDVPRTETDQTGPADPWQQPGTEAPPAASDSPQAAPLFDERPW